MKERFTLVELMIVVAIVGVLAAIAIPNFYRMQLRAKQAEDFGCLDGISRAEAAYHAAQDAYVDAAENPGAPFGKDAKPWDPAVAGWQDLGWSPDGDLRGGYMASVGAGAVMCVYGATNLDGADSEQFYQTCSDGSSIYPYEASGVHFKHDPGSVW